MIGIVIIAIAVIVWILGHIADEVCKIRTLLEEDPEIIIEEERAGDGDR